MPGGRNNFGSLHYFLLFKYIVISFLFSEFHHVLTCNGYTTLTNTQGHVSSPNYPSYNPRASRCHWSIHVQKGHIITLEFQTFDVGQGTECSILESRKTYVEVRDGTDNVTRGIYCGSKTPTAVSSHSNKMMVVYVANGYSSTKFTARYYTTKGEPCSSLIDSHIALTTLRYIEDMVGVLFKKLIIINSLTHSMGN